MLPVAGGSGSGRYDYVARAAHRSSTAEQGGREAARCRRRRSRGARQRKRQRSCPRLDRVARRLPLVPANCFARGGETNNRQTKRARREAISKTVCDHIRPPAALGDRRRLVRASRLSRAAEEHPQKGPPARRRYPRFRQSAAADIPGGKAARRAGRLGYFGSRNLSPRGLSDLSKWPRIRRRLIGAAYAHPGLRRRLRLCQRTAHRLRGRRFPRRRRRRRGAARWHRAGGQRRSRHVPARLG